MVWFNLLIFTFSDIVLGLVMGVVFANLWILYYIYTNNVTTPSVSAIDSKVKKNPNTTEHINTILYNTSLLVFILINYVFIHNINIQHVYNNNFYLSNNSLVYFFFSLLVLTIIIGSGLLLVRQNVSFNSEYLIFVVITIIGGFFLISSTNVYTSIFLLELVALMIFGKFTVTRVLTGYNAVDINSKVSNHVNQFSYGLFNSLFFQFWANFVSSVFLFFSLINVHYLFGTSNFFMLNFFLDVLALNFYVPNIFSTFVMIMLTTGLFIKLGLSPYQFFKIETYRGIPLFAVIVYTTLYLVVYIYFFTYLYIYQVPGIRQFINHFNLIILTISMCYLFSLLFDTKNFKAFLSYSTLITVINLFIVILII